MRASMPECQRLSFHACPYLIYLFLNLQYISSSFSDCGKLAGHGHLSRIFGGVLSGWTYGLNGLPIRPLRRGYTDILAYLAVQSEEEKTIGQNRSAASHHSSSGRLRP